MSNATTDEALVATHAFEMVPEDYDASSMHRARFWLVYLRLGLSVLTLESCAALGYYSLTGSRANRGLLISIAIVSILLATVGFCLSNRLAQHSLRRPIAIGFLIFAEVAVALAASLDGGIDSPVVYLLGLPVLVGAIALTPRQVLACGVTTVVCLIGVALSDGDVARSRFDLEMLCASIGGAIILALGMASAATGFERAQDRLISEVNRLTGSDPLTGCLNQRAFHSRLELEIERSRRYGYPLTLVVADVDLFKLFNDAHGHRAGDETLASVARVLLDSIRRSDAVARIGGDEFAMILPETSLERAVGADAVQGAIELAERILESLRADTAIGVTLSLGIAELSAANPTEQKIFRDADEALYRAKAGGRDRSVVSAGDPLAANELALAALESSRTRSPENSARIEQRLREELRHSSELRSIFDVLRESAPIGLGFFDRDFRALQINEYLAKVNGAPVEEQLGRTVEEMVPEIWPRLEPGFRKVLETGETVSLVAVPGKTAEDPDHEHYWSSSLYPVKLDEEIIGIGLVVLDVTDRKLVEEHQRTMMRTVVAALGATVEKRDPYTSGHQRRVAQISGAIAKEIGCDTELVEQIELAARIHDLGKVAVPAEILTRPGLLTDEESALIRGHAKIGYDILQSVGFAGPIPDMILQHHERLDGSGYPCGLHGDEISIGARVIAVADVVEAISSRRPYRAALGPEIALKEIRIGSGALFDATVVTACLKLAAGGQLQLTEGDAGA